MPFSRELLHNKKLHHFLVDPIIIRPTWLVFYLRNTEPEVINWFPHFFIFRDDSNKTKLALNFCNSYFSFHNIDLCYITLNVTQYFVRRFLKTCTPICQVQGFLCFQKKNLAFHFCIFIRLSIRMLCAKFGLNLPGGFREKKSKYDKFSDV